MALKKTKSSRNNHENKENIDIEELEAETARMHREVVGEKTIDSARHREKRNLSDNSRPLAEQQRPMSSNAGVKVLMDKTNNMNSGGNAFVIKRPTT